MYEHACVCSIGFGFESAVHGRIDRFDRRGRSIHNQIDRNCWLPLTAFSLISICMTGSARPWGAWANPTQKQATAKKKAKAKTESKSKPPRTLFFACFFSFPPPALLSGRADRCRLIARSVPDLDTHSCSLRYATLLSRSPPFVRSFVRKSPPVHNISMHSLTRCYATHIYHAAPSHSFPTQHPNPHRPAPAASIRLGRD